MNLKRILLDPDDEKGESEPRPPLRVQPWKPGWYPDPSMPTVVRWFDGTRWTKHIAPNDARAASRGAPRDMVRFLITAVIVVLVVLGLAGAAYYFFMLFMLTQWSSNK